jgi:hypothetical protein
MSTQWQKFELASAAVSFTVSPETVWPHHIFTVCCLWCSHSVMSMTSNIIFLLISVFSIQQPTYSLLHTTYILSCESLTNVCYLFFKVWPLLSCFWISLPPDYLPIPSTTLCCSFFPAFVYVHRSVHPFPNCCKESATFAFTLFAIFCIFYFLPSPNCLSLSYSFTHTE